MKMRPPLLLPLVFCLVTCQNQNHATTTSAPTPSATPQPTTLIPSTSKTPRSPTSSTHDPNTPGQKATWQHALKNVLNQLGNSATQPSITGNNSQELLANLMSQLPGLLRGLGGVDMKGDDVSKLLARFFSDPRAAGIPAWLESLTQGGNVSQLLGNVQPWLNQSYENQTQALLSSVFSDVSQGLQSLNLNANSSLSDIVSAIMNDSGLMSSLSTNAVEMLALQTGNSDPQSLLQEVFPVDPQSQCAADLQTWGFGLKQREMWALQMLDAMGKLQSGVLRGQLIVLGDYEECRGVSFTNNAYTLEAQFCAMALSLPEILAAGQEGALIDEITIHLCLPKSCTKKQLYGLFQPAVGAIGSEYEGIQFLYPRYPDGDNTFIGIVLTLGILALLCTAGTLYGAILDSNKKKEKQDAKTRPVKAIAYTNNAYVTDDNPATMAKGNDVNGDLSNDAANMAKGSDVNGDVPSGYLKHSKEEKMALADMEGGVAKTQNGLGAVTSVNDTSVTSKPNSITIQPSSEESLPSKLLLSFSVLRNGRKVLNCEQNQADIGCLHGIRVLSITWVVLGHTYSMMGDLAADRAGLFKVPKQFTFMAVPAGVLAVDTFFLLSRAGLFTVPKQFTFMVVPAGVLAVDTFFLLSGCLSSFLFLRTTKKSGLTVSGMVLYYVHRIWRLTPLYGLLIAFYVGVFPYLKEGPFMFSLGMDSKTSCRHYWYLNLLYVNNIVTGENLSKLCFGWSWYLSNDMQFSFLAPLVLIPWTLKGSLKRLNLVSFVLCGALILTHCISSGIISYTENVSLFKNSDAYMEKIYFPPWCRVGPYAVGLLLGYIMFVAPREYTMSKLSVFLGWTLATAVGLTLVYVRYDNIGQMMTKGLQWTRSENAAFESLDKVLWAICVAWIIFVCFKGYGGFVNTLLSWSAWTPLSRLTYGVYLVHTIVIYVLAGNFMKPLYMNNWTVTMMFLAVTLLSFMVSFICSMLIEAPTLGLEKVVLGRIFRRQ